MLARRAVLSTLGRPTRLIAATAAAHPPPLVSVPGCCSEATSFPKCHYFRKTAATRQTSSVTSVPNNNDLETNKTHSTMVLPDFNDAQAAYEAKSTRQVIRALVVLNLCRIPFLAQNATSIVDWARRYLLGDRLMDSLLRHTLFGHFCGGESEQDMKPVIDELRRNGIGGILDYAAESDGSNSSGNNNNNASNNDNDIDIDESSFNQPARVYDYESEAMCDHHVHVFSSCIQAVQNVTPEGFAALKVTALGNPKLLERMSNAIMEARNLFAKFDANGDGVLSREEFEEGYRLYFNDGDTKIPSLIERLDPDHTGTVDYIAWTKLLSPSDLPEITASCRETGPLVLACPSDEELELMVTMHARAHSLAKLAFECKTRLLIDAEQARFQPAIDNLALELQRNYNDVEKTSVPIIFNTYQCYLKDVSDRVKVDVEQSERFGYHFAAKLVRGAYHESENARAEEMGYPSPIHDTENDTHKCYNNMVAFLLKHSVQTDKTVEIMCATHNQESIEKAIRVMNKLGIDRTAPTVHFAQLFGMADNLTYNLGRHNLRVYKYVPYGKVAEVMPYLMRRAQENSALMGNTATELALLKTELKRRMMPF